MYEHTLYTEVRWCNSNNDNDEIKQTSRVVICKKIIMSVNDKNNPVSIFAIATNDKIWFLFFCIQNDDTFNKNFKFEKKS